MTTPAPAPDPDRIRASDADRERAASVLHQAMSDGRLTLAEVDERLKSVYAAKTFAELRPIVSDLPGHESALPSPHEIARQSSPVSPAAGNRVVGAGIATASAVAVFSSSIRKGTWVVPEMLDATAVFGSVELDLTEALFAAPEVTIKVFAMMGSIEIIAPDDITVISDASGVLGSVDNKSRTAAAPGYPVVRVVGIAIMGSVEIKPPKRRLFGKRT